MIYIHIIHSEMATLRILGGMDPEKGGAIERDRGLASFMPLI